LLFIRCGTPACRELKGRPADPMPPAQLLSLGPCFVLLQNPNDLLFLKRLLRIVDLLAIDSTISWREFRGAGQP
jgi:hypothetical protein